MATDKRRVGNPATLAAGAGFEPASPLGLLPITQTQRPVINALPGDIEYTSPGNKCRCSLAVELRSDQMGKWRDRTEAIHAGNRTRTAKAFATDGTPSLWWRITDHLRPIEIGVTNRIRTGTNAFTGRDAAVTS